MPFQAFQTKDAYLVIALSWGVPNQWALLCAELGIPEIIDDPRFYSAAARSRNHAELEPIMQAAFLTKDSAEWLGAFDRFEIPSGPLNNIEEVARMPQVAARDMLRPVPHKILGEVLLTNTPVKLSETPGGIRGTSPDMGEHSREVLAEVLGLDAARLDDLIQRKIVWEQRPEVELG